MELLCYLWWSVPLLQNLKPKTVTLKPTNIPFLLANKKKIVMASSSSSSDHDVVYKRSKSTTTAGSRHSSNAAIDYSETGFSPKKRGEFQSFLYISSSMNIAEEVGSDYREKVPSLTITTTTNGSIVRSEERCLLGSSSSKFTFVLCHNNSRRNSKGCTGMKVKSLMSSDKRLFTA